MIEKYLSQLEFPELKEQKIKAVEIPVDSLKTYMYYDDLKHLHVIFKSDTSVVENRIGIKVTMKKLDLIDHGKFSFIDVVCMNKDAQEEFLKIVTQIIEHFNEHKDIAKAIKIIINKWYFFLQKDNGTKLNENEVKGLIGELLYMKNRPNHVPLETVVKAWKGPEAGLRDFNFKSFDVEVKASTKEVGHVHTISGGIQLNSEEIPLYVYSVSLKKSESTNAVTLNKLAENLCLEAGTDSLLLNSIFEKFEELGAFIPELNEYDHFSYELKNILCVKIDQSNLSDFLIDNEKTRISNIKYDFDFNGLNNNEIDYD